MTSVPLIDLAAQMKTIEADVRTAIAEVLQRGDFIMGEAVSRFEENYAQWVGCQHAVGVNSGTDALRLILLGLEIGPGDEVIVPANTFFATASAVSSVGARPVFVDVEEETANLAPQALDAAWTPRTRAVIGVHLYGRLCAVDRIGSWCHDRGVHFIEDAAQAHGARREEGCAGSFGIAGAFSFYPGKNLGACGDGGAVVTDDERLRDAMLKWRNFGQRAKHHHELPGINTRLDTLQAAILDIKLRHIDSWNQRRRELVVEYVDKLSDLDGVTVLTGPAGEEHVHHLFVVRVRERDRVLAALQEQGIGAQIHYPTPLHMTPAYASLGCGRGDFPVSERLADEILSLPLYAELGSEGVSTVVNALEASLVRSVST